MTTASTTVPIQGSNQAESASLPVATLAGMGLIAAAFLPLVSTHLFQLWARPHYQFFPIVLVGAGILAYMRFPPVASLRPGSAAASWGLFGFAWLLLAMGELLHSSYLGAVAALFLLLAALWSLGGSTLFRDLLPAWLFLWLLIPPPFGLDNALVLMLQRLTTRWSSALLDQFGVFHVIAGNVVEVGNRRFFVAEACAGINSLYSVLTCAIFYVFFTRTAPIRAALLIASAIAWVLLANVLRVFLVAYLAKRHGIDLAEGWRHEALGYALFAVAVMLTWSTDRFLMFLTPPRWRQRPAAPGSQVAASEEPGRTGAWAPLVRGSWLQSRLAAGACGLLLVGHFVFYVMNAEGAPALAAAPVHLDRLDKSALPENLDGWRREKFFEETRNPGSAFGEFSRYWVYRGDSQAGGFALDYPFPTWHELQECYRNQGWEVEERADLAASEAGTPAFFSVRILKKAGMRNGHLFFCEFDRTGRVLEAERGGLGATLRRQESALGRWLTWNQGTVEYRPVPPIYQFQLLVESDEPLRTADAVAAQARFFKAYQTVREKLID